MGVKCDFAHVLQVHTAWGQGSAPPPPHPQWQLWPSTTVVFLVNSWLALDRLTAFSRSSCRGQRASAMTVFWMAQAETELRRQGVAGVPRIKLKAAGRPVVAGACLVFPVSASSSSMATNYGNPVFHATEQPISAGSQCLSSQWTLRSLVKQALSRVRQHGQHVILSLPKVNNLSLWGWHSEAGNQNCQVQRGGPSHVWRPIRNSTFIQSGMKYAPGIQQSRWPRLYTDYMLRKYFGCFGLNKMYY